LPSACRYWTCSGASLARTSGILGYVPGVAGMHDVDDYATGRQMPGLLVYRYEVSGTTVSDRSAIPPSAAASPR
jgi:hypothetical protein